MKDLVKSFVENHKELIAKFDINNLKDFEQVIFRTWIGTHLRKLGYRHDADVLAYNVFNEWTNYMYIAK